MADNEEIVIVKDVIALAATAASIQMHVNTCSYPIRLKSAKFIHAVAVTANDTNFRTFTVKKGAGGTAVVTPVTTEVAGGNLAAGDVTTLALLTTGGGSTDLRKLAPGEIHEVSAAHTASGVAIGGSWILTYEPVRGV